MTQAENGSSMRRRTRKSSHTSLHGFDLGSVPLHLLAQLWTQLCSGSASDTVVKAVARGGSKNAVALRRGAREQCSRDTCLVETVGDGSVCGVDRIFNYVVQTLMRASPQARSQVFVMLRRCLHLPQLCTGAGSLAVSAPQGSERFGFVGASIPLHYNLHVYPVSLDGAFTDTTRYRRFDAFEMPSYVPWRLRLLSGSAEALVVAVEVPLNDEPPCCTVCLDEENGDAWARPVCCSHVFHRQCLLKSLHLAGARCPMCRAEPVATITAE